MAQMEDSPLSIAASIAGILTFIAAICTAIYIRYTTLRNSRDEFLATLHASTTSLKEMTVIPGIRLDESVTEDETDPLQWLVRELFAVELEISEKCKSVIQHNIDFRAKGSSASLVYVLGFALLNLGATRMVVRWYRVRERMLELVRQREMIKSRILFHQVAVAASYVHCFPFPPPLF